MAVSLELSLDVNNSYLPGRGDTMIKKVVHPWRGSAIAQPAVADPSEFLKCRNLDCIICGSWGLRSRYPLKECSKTEIDLGTKSTIEGIN